MNRIAILSVIGQRPHLNLVLQFFPAMSNAATSYGRSEASPASVVALRRRIRRRG
jgi:hypothetical protein